MKPSCERRGLVRIDPVEGDGVEFVDERERRRRVERLDVGLEALVGALGEGAGEFGVAAVEDGEDGRRGAVDDVEGERRAGASGPQTGQARDGVVVPMPMLPDVLNSPTEELLTRN